MDCEKIYCSNGEMLYFLRWKVIIPFHFADVKYNVEYRWMCHVSWALQISLSLLAMLDSLSNYLQSLLIFFDSLLIVGLLYTRAFHHFRERSSNEPLRKHPELEKLLQEEYRSLDDFRAKEKEAKNSGKECSSSRSGGFIDWSHTMDIVVMLQDLAVSFCTISHLASSH